MVKTTYFHYFFQTIAGVLGLPTHPILVLMQTLRPILDNFLIFSLFLCSCCELNSLYSLSIKKRKQGEKFIHFIRPHTPQSAQRTSIAKQITESRGIWDNSVSVRLDSKVRFDLEYLPYVICERLAINKIL